jgi:hypothetical protein
VTFSDYIVYADESGSPVLSADLKDFPVFVLVFVIAAKDDYISRVVPAVQRLKFDFVGHDQIILHERDIRRQSGAFAFLQVDAMMREQFLGRVGELVGNAPIHVACAVIDKKALAMKYVTPWDPYDLALNFCLERTATFLSGKGQRDKKVSIIFESRGETEDRHLELEFRRVVSGAPKVGNRVVQMQHLEWEAIFSSKASNSSGLQVADLLARPIGLRHLRPSQQNRAFETLKPKIISGLPKVFP